MLYFTSKILLFAKNSYHVKQLQLDTNIVFAADIIRHNSRTSIQYDPNFRIPSTVEVDNITAVQLTQYGFEMERYN
ncbi:MAG: hypothetical protein AB8V06_01605 [Francisella endosymbiont of Hyalomma asiaticum]